MLENSVEFFGPLFCFVLFFLALVSWGRLLNRSLALPYSLLLGTAFAMAIPQVLSLFHLLDQWWIATVFTIIPLPFLWLSLRRLDWAKLIPKPTSASEKILLFALFLLFFCRFFEASYPQPHGDPLYYNLLAAAKWRALGQIQFVPELPLLFQSSWWDYLYLWPAMFYQVEPGRGLIESQIMSQWLHFFVGFGGSLLVWNRILDHFKYDNFTKYLSSIVLIACASLWWTATLAKNDWGAVFLVLGGFGLLLEQKILLGSLILGMAFIAKGTTLPVVFVFLAAFCIRKHREIPKVAFGFFLGILPIVIRNVLATGNPIFPAPFLHLGNEYLSESFLEYVVKFAGGSFAERDWAALLNNRKDVIQDHIFIPLGFATLVLGVVKKKTSGMGAWLGLEGKIFLLSIVSFFIFILISGPWAENRLFGPGLVVLSGTGAVLLSRQATNKFLTWALVVLALGTSRIPTYMPRKFFENFPPSILSMNSGDLKLTIQKQIPVGTAIVTSGDNELYYLSMYSITDAVNNPNLDKIVRNNTDLRPLLLAIKNEGFRYLLHTTRYDGQCWEGLCERLQKEISNFDSQVVISGKSGVLLDLDRIK